MKLFIYIISKEFLLGLWKSILCKIFKKVIDVEETDIESKKMFK